MSATEFNLTAARLNKGMTPAELAEDIGVGVKVIRRLEAGGGAWPRNAKKIADYFGVQVTDLMPVEREAAA